METLYDVYHVAVLIVSSSIYCQQKKVGGVFNVHVPSTLPLKCDRAKSSILKLGPVQI